MRAVRIVWVLVAGLMVGAATDVVISRRADHSVPRRFEGMSIEEAKVFDRACKDCHSNDTAWPWYSRVPPISLGVVADVRRGRKAWNISEWASYSRGNKIGFLTAIAIDAVNDNMPPKAYRLMHPNSVLSANDRELLTAWSTRERHLLRKANAAVCGGGACSFILGVLPREYSLIPRAIPRVETALRQIVTEFPPPGSLSVLETLYGLEPIAMRGQPPVVWNRAEGFSVWDAYGNKWIDWSSGVLIANAGHGRKEIVDAIVAQAQSHLLTNYCFPSEIRARLVERLTSLLPEPLKKVFLLTTGSETIEAVIKLSRMHGMRSGGRSKHVIVSFDKAFHGRTLGSQQAGGIPGLKEWIANMDPGFVQLPFPDGFRNQDTSFEGFQRALRVANIEPGNVAAVILETYQGGSASFAPVEYMRALRDWCFGHRTLLVCDEVQAGFGRCGTMWGFEHYGIVPDLTCFGKGISSSLPLAAVAGRPDVMDLPPSGSMTSTHTGNPVCCAAALASIDLIVKERLAENARVVGNVLHERLRALKQRTPTIGHVAGKGLVAGVACIKPATQEPDGDLAWNVVERCIERGVLMFSPVGVGGATVKISPPLVITEEAIIESAEVLEQAFQS